MKGLLFALALLCGLEISRAQQTAPTPEVSPSPAAEKVSNAPKMNEAVNLTETARPENIEIPAPPDEKSPDKSGEIKEPLPDEEATAPAPPVNGKVEVTAAEAGKIVRAAVGNLVTITLQSNPSTGYNWELRDFDYGVAAFYKSETIAADSGNVLFGAPTKTVVTLQAVKPGTQEVKLVYRRLWEPPDRVAETFQFQLQVGVAQPSSTVNSASPAPTPAAP